MCSSGIVANMGRHKGGAPDRRIGAPKYNYYKKSVSHGLNDYPTKELIRGIINVSGQPHGHVTSNLYFLTHAKTPVTRNTPIAALIEERNPGIFYFHPTPAIFLHHGITKQHLIPYIVPRMIPLTQNNVRQKTAVDGSTYRPGRS